MTRRLTPRGQERRNQIIEYATELFAEKGYHPTSVADIVDGLGVGKGVFYWYFDSKEELFREILKAAQLDMRRRQRTAITDVDDPVERMQLGVRAAVLWLAEQERLNRLLEFARTEAGFAGFLERGQKVLVTDAATHLKDAIAEGRIPDRDPEVLANAVIGITGQLTAVYIHQRHEDPEQVADWVVDLVLHGIGPVTPPSS